MKPYTVYNLILFYTVYILRLSNFNFFFICTSTKCPNSPWYNRTLCWIIYLVTLKSSDLTLFLFNCIHVSFLQAEAVYFTVVFGAVWFLWQVQTWISHSELGNVLALRLHCHTFQICTKYLYDKMIIRANFKELQPTIVFLCHFVRKAQNKSKQEYCGWYVNHV